MSEEELVAAASAYEELHVPALFDQWTARVLDPTALSKGESELDLACGTGVLARAALRRVGAGSKVAGLDPGVGMLAVARQNEPSIDWREGVAESLPFDDESFDAVVSQFGLMFFPDRAQALAEMYRVLKSGGRVSVAVWDMLENTDAYPEIVELLERLAGKAAASALQAPFVLGDHEALRSLFEKAGFDHVSTTAIDGTAKFPSIRILVEAELRGWLPLMGVNLEEVVIERILTESEDILKGYLNDDGEAEFNAPAIVTTGKKA